MTRRTGFALRGDMAGPLLVFCIAVLGLAGPALYGGDPLRLTGEPLVGPGSPSAWLGTDQVGQDLLAQLLHGGRQTVAVGWVAGLGASLLGACLGACGGYFGGPLDRGLTRVTEFTLLLPPLLLMLVAVALFGARFATVCTTFILVAWPNAARPMRAEFLKIRALDYARASRALGAGHAHIALRVMLPNALPVLLSALALSVCEAVLAEVSLSFLGLSDSNQVSWGRIMGAGRHCLPTCWWVVTLPCIPVSLFIVGTLLSARALQRALEPRSGG